MGCTFFLTNSLVSNPNNNNKKKRTMPKRNKALVMIFSFLEEMKYVNRKMDDEEDLNVLTFEDLLYFSYQVAKGMEFLESRSVSLMCGKGMR